MRDGKPFEKLLAPTRKVQVHFARVVPAARAVNPTPSFESIREFDRRVVPDLQAFGESADSGFDSCREPLDRKQGLVLLWLDTDCLCRAFAEIQETPDLVAEFGQCSVVDRAFQHVPVTHYIV